MTFEELARAKETIQFVAEQNGTTAEEVRRSMQEALDDAWSTAWQPGNIRAQLVWQQHFPGPRKPTVEEFIITYTGAAKVAPVLPYMFSGIILLGIKR